jgi:hypothetical protein
MNGRDVVGVGVYATRPFKGAGVAAPVRTFAQLQATAGHCRRLATRPRRWTAPPFDEDFLFVVCLFVEAMGIEPTNLLHAMQALYQLSYAPEASSEGSRAGFRQNRPMATRA